ncbi:MAG: hypothetical protein J0626_03565, partial [Rhodospirillaceae bacterium]|nr:hypothetical protein [Rhodospirillaceae bacterium]
FRSAVQGQGCNRGAIADRIKASMPGGRGESPLLQREAALQEHWGANHLPKEASHSQTELKEHQTTKQAATQRANMCVSSGA